jgi:hypothetical protein
MMLQELESPFTTPPEVHPEDRPAGGGPTLNERLAQVLPLAVLAGLVGAFYGAAALSSAFAIGTVMEVVSLLPLVGALVVLATAWTAAIFCMSKDESP